MRMKAMSLKTLARAGAVTFVAATMVYVTTTPTFDAVSFLAGAAAGWLALAIVEGEW